MLYLSLLPAAVLVGLAHAAARRPPRSVRWGLFLGLGVPVALFYGCGMVGSPAVLLLVPALAAALGAWAVVRHRGGRFWPLSGAALVAAYLIAFAVFTAPRMREMAQLKAEHPFVSLADRLPEPARAARPLPEPAALALSEQDADTRRETDGIRNRMLEQLHERTTEQFVNAPGFGVGRVPLLPSRGWVIGRGRDGPPAQPGGRGTSAGDADADDPAEPREADDAARALHGRAVLDFANPAGWGLVRGRDRVAGFRSHGFSRVPDETAGRRADGPPPPGGTTAWRVETVDLVGLLLHPGPVVYVSDKLPAMDQLRGATAPTRPPDEFEAAGLAKFRAGDDYHAAGTADRLRLVASLRNGKTCADCHGGEVGDLLGAFAYTLRAVGPSR